METRIRNASLSDLPALLDFAKSVGRFISADEVETWLQVDPQALFVAEAPVDGKLVGACCGTRLTPDLGFMGLYVVLEEYRGKGIGSKLWKSAREHLGDRNIGVRGDPVNFMKYKEREGFCHVEDYTIVYYEYFGGSVPTGICWLSEVEVVTYFEGRLIPCQKKLSESTQDLKACCTLSKIESGEVKFGLNMSAIKTNSKNKSEPSAFAFKDDLNCGGKRYETKLLRENLLLSCAVEDAFKQSIQNELGKNFHEFQEFPPKSDKSFSVEDSKADVLCGVVAFDKSLHKRDRSLVVRQTFCWSSCRSKVALLGNKVVGYACLRNVVTGHWIISPFYADSEAVAEILLFELLSEFNFSKAPKGIRVRFPDKNNACKRLVEKFGFKENSVRILTGFTKRCINVDTSKVYSFHSTVFCSE